MAEIISDPLARLIEVAHKISDFSGMILARPIHAKNRCYLVLSAGGFLSPSALHFRRTFNETFQVSL